MMMMMMMMMLMMTTVLQDMDMCWDHSISFVVSFWCVGGSNLRDRGERERERESGSSVLASTIFLQKKGPLHLDETVENSRCF